MGTVADALAYLGVSDPLAHMRASDPLERVLYPVLAEQAAEVQRIRMHNAFVGAWNTINGG